MFLCLCHLCLSCRVEVGESMAENGSWRKCAIDFFRNAAAGAGNWLLGQKCESAFFSVVIFWPMAVGTYRHMWRNKINAKISTADNRLIAAQPKASLFITFQAAQTRRSGQTAVGQSVGLGQDLSQRLHGLALLRHQRTSEKPRGRLVQAVIPRGGRVLRDPMYRWGWRNCGGTAQQTRGEVRLLLAFFRSVVRTGELAVNTYVVCSYFSCFYLIHPLCQCVIVSFNCIFRWRRVRYVSPPFSIHSISLTLLRVLCIPHQPNRSFLSKCLRRLSPFFPKRWRRMVFKTSSAPCFADLIPPRHFSDKLSRSRAGLSDRYLFVVSVGYHPGSGPSLVFLTWNLILLTFLFAVLCWFDRIRHNTCMLCGEIWQFVEATVLQPLFKMENFLARRYLTKLMSFWTTPCSVKLRDSSEKTIYLFLNQLYASFVLFTWFSFLLRCALILTF